MKQGMKTSFAIPVILLLVTLASMTPAVADLYRDTAVVTTEAPWLVVSGGNKWCDVGTWTLRIVNEGGVDIVEDGPEAFAVVYVNKYHQADRQAVISDTFLGEAAVDDDYLQLSFGGRRLLIIIMVLALVISAVIAVSLEVERRKLVRVLRSWRELGSPPGDYFCDECGTTVTETDDLCPNCGVVFGEVAGSARRPSRFGAHEWIMMVAGAIAALVLFFFLGASLISYLAMMRAPYYHELMSVTLYRQNVLLAILPLLLILAAFSAFRSWRRVREYRGLIEIAEQAAETCGTHFCDECGGCVRVTDTICRTCGSFLTEEEVAE